MKDFFENPLLKTSITSFIDQDFESDQAWQAQIIVNRPKAGERVLTTLLEALEKSDRFWISVAFLTTSGVASIHEALKNFSKRGGKGTIIISDYLSFTDPEALRRLSKFVGITVYLVEAKQFHGKGYLFQREGHYQLLIGSSNLTATALSTNDEINLSLYAENEGSVIRQFKAFFDETLEDNHSCFEVNESVINAYEERYKKRQSIEEIEAIKKIETQTFVPNLMQETALESLADLRREGKNKALIVSATGTGKTLLAAFDAKAFGAKRCLFVVHRQNIARRAMKSFRDVFGHGVSMGLFSGGIQESECDFIFATVQTLSNPKHCAQFDRDTFDYVIFDESHHAATNSYKAVLDYFKPKFLLGMTATPERSDGYDIYEFFDHNVASDIRLQTAMSANILSPFHYFGVSDLVIDGESQDDKTLFNRLVCDERVNRIIEAAEEYGTDSGDVRGLIFCSRVEEAKELSQKLNARGYRARALSGQNTEGEREDAIRALEKEAPEHLQYLLTVDIFNEGVDIPRINQVILLRETSSVIVFVQQLGRGLRKAPGKRYLTVIDFIGNYDNNYMIPLALTGDLSHNKNELIKRFIDTNSAIPGTSTVSFDAIAKKRIFEAIEKAKLNELRDLKEEYKALEARLGREPMMCDFIRLDRRDPLTIVKKLKSFYQLKLKVDGKAKGEMKPENLTLLEYLSTEVLNAVRVEETMILKGLLDFKRVVLSEVSQAIESRYGYRPTSSTLESALSNINLRYATQNKDKKIQAVGEIEGYRLVRQEGQDVLSDETLQKALEDKVFGTYLLDAIEASLMTFEKKFEPAKWKDGFIRYERYARKDVYRIFNWAQKPVEQNVGGYLADKAFTHCPIFVNYEKAVDIAASIQYEDRFVTRERFVWKSKNKRTLKSPDVQGILNQATSHCRLPLFVKKNHAEGSDFYYLGDLSVVEGSAKEEVMPNTQSKVVEIEFKLDQPLKDSIYRYLIG